MKNISCVLGMLFLGNLVTSSTPEIILSEKVEEDLAVKADYALTRNKYNITFSVKQDSILKTKNK